MNKGILTLTRGVELEHNIGDEDGGKRVASS